MATRAPEAVIHANASRDAEAARRIAEALRAAGVEVWFDQSELRGGDAWDQKIRKQVHECALFVPVVSQHTQHRREGYFRREWKLAVDRLNDIADGTPFMVPVCVDDTRDREALVPEAFLAVQWTRLPRGETPNEFCQRVQNLLAGESIAGTVGSGTTEARPVTIRPSRSRLPWAVVAAVAAVAAVLLVALIWALRPHAGPAHPAEARPAAPLPVSQPPPTAPVSEARQLLAKPHHLESVNTIHFLAGAEFLPPGVNRPRPTANFVRPTQEPKIKLCIHPYPSGLFPLLSPSRYPHSSPKRPHPHPHPPPPRVRKRSPCRPLR